MRLSEVSKRYARALYEIAKEDQKQQMIFDQLRTLGEAFSIDPLIQNFFKSPELAPEHKRKLLQETLAGQGVAKEIVDLFSLLADKGRLSLFSEIVQAFELEADRDHGVTRGLVRSASALGPEARARLEKNVTEVTGKKVILKYQEDPKLIGGLIAQVGGWTFDDSLDSHLSRLNEDLKRRAH